MNGNYKKDEELIYKYKTGDIEAFKELHTRYSKHSSFLANELIKKYVRLHLDQEEIALILLEELFIIIGKYKAKAGTRLYSYWRKAAENRFNTYLRENYRPYFENCSVVSLNEPVNWNGKENCEIYGEYDDKLTKLMISNDLDFLAAHTKLSKDEKNVFRLLRKGLSKKEIAEIYGWRHSKACKISARLIDKLKISTKNLKR